MCLCSFLDQETKSKFQPVNTPWNQQNRHVANQQSIVRIYSTEKVSKAEVYRVGAQDARTLAEPPLKFCEQTRADLVARVAFHAPETALLPVVVNQGLAGLFELVEALLPRVDRIIFSLS